MFSQKDFKEPLEITKKLEKEDELSEAIYNFNIQPKKGILKLCDFFHLPHSPESMAHILHTTCGLMSEKIGEYLANEKNEQVLLCYFKELDLKTTFMMAIRKALSGSLRLPGEAEQIDRIVQGFAKVYVSSNPNVFKNVDVAYILAFALIMLNSDLHNPNMQKKMTSKEFIENIRGVLKPDDISDESLHEMFQDIKENQFTFGNTSKDEFLALSAPKLHGFLRKKAKKWNSYWTTHFFVLANSCLYYFKSDSPENKDDPIGMIQLVSVNVSLSPNKPNRIIISSTQGPIQYVRFDQKKPELMNDINEIYLEAPSIHAAEKWYYKINHSIVYSNFGNENTEKTPKMISSFSSSAIGNSISETSE